jgi:hypothetical protein
MKLLVYYIDFHWDNYQGGSGKNYELRYALDVPSDLAVGNVRSYVIDKISELATKSFRTG